MRGAFLPFHWVFAAWVLAAGVLTAGVLAACLPPDVTAPTGDAGPVDAGVDDAGPPPRCPTDRTATSTRVITSEGAERGVETESGVLFLGVRYAAAPTADQRFGPASAPPCISDEHVASTYGAGCPQAPNGVYSGDEDCLFLNIFSPPEVVGTGARRPVLFFVHGGANVFGSGADRLPDGTYLYDGTVLAPENDVVVVTVNYRLGALGFLVHEGLDDEGDGENGNQALRDLVRALLWVQENIAGFGGDPDRVLLFGESAGALNTCALLASPRADGLFSAALLQSGACFAASRDERLAGTRQLEQATGCDQGTPAENLSCLRALAPEALVRAPVFTAPQGDPWSLSAGPVVDGDLLPGTPIDVIRAGAHNAVPLVVGSNADETSVWAPSLVGCAAYESAIAARVPDISDEVIARYPCADFATPAAAWSAVTTDATFTCPARAIARAAVAGQSEPVYRYLWSQPALGIAGSFGAFHASELSFIFGHLRVSGVAPSDDEVNLSAAARGYWARFAETGVPDDDSVLSWPPFSDADEPYLDFATPLSSGTDLAPSRCDFWDGIAAASG